MHQGMQQTPSQVQTLFFSKKPDWHSNWGDHIVKIPVGKSSMKKISIGKIPVGKSLRSSSKDRQFFFWLNEFKIFDFTFDYFITVSIEFDWVVKKIKNSSFLKNVLRKISGLFCDHLNVSCTLQPPIEDHYNRENFPGASRPTKTLTGVLIGTENWLSLGRGVCCKSPQKHVASFSKRSKKNYVFSWVYLSMVLNEL